MSTRHTHNSSMRQALINAGVIRPAIVRAKPTKFRKTKARRTNKIPYRELVDNYIFKRKGRVYTKVCDAFSVDERTGKDAIFLHHELVEPLYPAQENVGQFCAVPVVAH